MPALMTVCNTVRFALLTLIAGLAVPAAFLVFAPVALAEERPGGGIVTMDEQHGDCRCTYVYSKTHEYLPCSYGHCHAGEYDFAFLFHRTTTVLRDCFDDLICDIDIDVKCSGRRCYSHADHPMFHDYAYAWGIEGGVYCMPESTVSHGNLLDVQAKKVEARK